MLVHVDARADRQVWNGFQDLAERYAQVELVPRQTTGWASWGLVQATINGLECSLGLDCTHVVKMTGQDYPLRPIKAISAFFDENRDMSVDPPRRGIPVDFLAERDGGLSRTKHWHMAVRGRSVRVPLNRRPPDGIIPFYGQAQVIHFDALGALATRAGRASPRAGQVLSATWMPNELFIPSLAMSSPMASDVSGANLWFTDWSGGGSTPGYSRREDIDELTTVALGQAGELPGGGTKFFARKFDATVDEEVLDLIDQRLLSCGGKRTQLR